METSTPNLQEYRAMPPEERLAMPAHRPAHLYPESMRLPEPTGPTLTLEVYCQLSPAERKAVPFKVGSDLIAQQMCINLRENTRERLSGEPEAPLTS